MCDQPEPVPGGLPSPGWSGVAAAGPAGVILREKDLPPEDYRALAERARALCRARGVPCILHSFPETAEALGGAGHSPAAAPAARPSRRSGGGLPGSGGHPATAWRTPGKRRSWGVPHITAGHVFATDCKKGPSPQGLDFPPGGVPRRGSPGVGHRRHHPRTSRPYGRPAPEGDVS